jgi:hypothetical protein
MTTNSKLLIGTWSCPICGEENQDNEEVYSTCCHNGHLVHLSVIDDKGNREAFYRETIANPETIKELQSMLIKPTKES